MAAGCKHPNMPVAKARGELCFDDGMGRIQGNRIETASLLSFSYRIPSIKLTRHLIRLELFGFLLNRMRKRMQ